MAGHPTSGEAVAKVARYLEMLRDEAKAGRASPIPYAGKVQNRILVVRHSPAESRSRQIPKRPMVRIKNAGGFPRAGTLGIVRSRLDIDAIAECYDEAEVLARQVRDALERIAQRDKYPDLIPISTAAGIRMARREDGPYDIRDETFRWPTIWSSYIVDTYRTEPVLPSIR